MVYGDDIESNWGKMILCEVDKMPTSPFSLYSKRRATADEIIEYFKTKEK